MRTVVVLLSALVGFTAAIPSLEKRQGSCPKVHIIVARASGEAKGEGMIGRLSTAVKGQFPGATSEAVDYPAALAPYGPSESKGVKAAGDQLRAFVKKCATTKIVLMGYSQGADVVGSVLCGGGDHVSEQAIGRLPKTKVDLGPPVPPIEPEFGSHVVAAVLMGDPRFTKGMPGNKGTAKNTGRFPHSEAQDCKGYIKRIVSFCDSGDEFCDAGKDLGPHMGYMGKYSKEAQDFIKSRVNGATTFPLVGDV